MSYPVQTDLVGSGDDGLDMLVFVGRHGVLLFSLYFASAGVKYLLVQR